jgi:lambda family phage portal protein
MFGFFKKNIKVPKRRNVIRKRSYEAAGTGRLLSSWTTQNTSADYDILRDVQALRARSRELFQNNDYLKRFINLCITNIIGPNGITLQNKCTFNSGALDKTSNDIIESNFKAWGKNCCVDGQLNWMDIQRICISSVALDGEIFIVKHKIKGINQYSYALQLLEADYLDVNFNNQDANIRMGIEYNGYGQPIAYHFFKTHPGDSQKYTMSVNERVRVPAKNVIHLYFKERPSQSRGVPWGHSAMTRLNHIGAYEETEIIAARVASAKMGIMYTPNGDDFKGSDLDSDGNVEIDVEPGTFDQLPIGYDFKMFDPTHPGGNFEPFMKTTLRGAAAGLNVAYHSLTNDLESVNYSSLRAGAIDERDHWRVKQRWISRLLCDGVFVDWLDQQMMTGIINLPYSKFEKYCKPEWSARSWDWVDPKKDAEAAVIEINSGLKTRTDILAEQGRDFYEQIEIMKQEKEAMLEAGIELKAEVPKNANTEDKAVSQTDGD